MIRRFLVVCLLLCAGVPALPSSAKAQPALMPAEIAAVAAARDTVQRIRSDIPANAQDFNGLLILRQQIEPRRNELRDLVARMQERRAQAQARLAEIGPPPAVGAPAEDPAIAFDRRRQEGLASDLETQIRSVRATLQQAEDLWDELTDMRRKLFTARIFDHQDSFLSPDLWRRVVAEAIPQVSRRIGRKMAEISDGIAMRGGWPILLGLAGFMAAVAAALIWLHRWMARRRAQDAPEAATQPSKGAVAARAALILGMRAIPFAAAAMAFGLAVTRFEIVPEDVQTFILGLSAALFAFGLGNGAVQAAFSPRNAAYRVVRTDDATARLAVRTLNTLLLVYLAGLVIHGIEQMLSVLLVLTVFTTGAIALAMVVAGALTLLGARPAPEDAPVSGLVQAPLHLARPILWLTAAAIVVALMFGYISLAGFIAGRAIATAVILCIAILVYITIESVFHDALDPGTPVNQRLSRTLGVQPNTIDLAGTIIAGILRVLTVVFTVLVLFSPWGIEFGNKNPFDDVFFGVRFGDIRGLIGAAGIAIILFGFGLVGTRLFVGWLDQRLLPRTAMDTGMRHSISTIAGYVGFAVALAIALGQAGVQLQNIALVAGALSVGIGFGLQQVVSNFVAGLIVLAERPIRVGDVVVVKGEEGKVRKISVRSTELALGERSTLIVPNADFISSIVKNRSLVDPTQRVKIVLLLAHDADIKAAFAILLDAAAGHRHVLQSSAPTVHITKITEAGVEIELKFICDHLDNMDLARTQILYGTLLRFKEAGIELAVAKG